MNDTITQAFSARVGNTGETKPIGEGRTPFQRDMLFAIASRPDFEHFTTDNGVGITGKTSPMFVAWYQGGRFHSVRLGATRILVAERTF